jgi:hypothetical protein
VLDHAVPMLRKILTSSCSSGTSPLLRHHPMSR